MARMKSSAMRWAFSLLLALILSISPALSAHPQSHATVHQFLPPSLQQNQKHHHPLSLTPSESRLVFSTIYGVSRFHTMGFVGQFSQVLDLQRQWKQDDLFGQDSQGGVVVTIAGVVEEHEESLAGRKSAGNVLFKVTESPPGKVFLDLMTRMMGQRSRSRESRGKDYMGTRWVERFPLCLLWMYVSVSN